MYDLALRKFATGETTPPLEGVGAGTGTGTGTGAGAGADAGTQSAEKTPFKEKVKKLYGKAKTEIGNQVSTGTAEAKKLRLRAKAGAGLLGAAILDTSKRAVKAGAHKTGKKLKKAIGMTPTLREVTRDVFVGGDGRVKPSAKLGAGLLGAGLLGAGIHQYRSDRKK